MTKVQAIEVSVPQLNSNENSGSTLSVSTPQTVTQLTISPPPKPTVCRAHSSTCPINQPPRPSGNIATKLPNPMVGVKRTSSPQKKEEQRTPKHKRVKQVKMLTGLFCVDMRKQK